VRVKGQDWSGYQATRPSVSGLSFVFIKATEGTSYVNPHMAAQTAWARKNNLTVGFYHFLRPGSMSAQVTHFLSELALRDGDMLALDWEDAGVSCADKDAAIADVKKAKPGHKVVLYCNKYFWKSLDTTSNCGDGLWIADYDNPAGSPDVKDHWTFHQYGDTPTDLDVANVVDVAALRKWANPTATSTTHVSLSHVIYAAAHDPKLAQGATTHAADVKPVEHALNAEGLLSAKYDADGSFGTATIAAYAAWQRKCGFSGSDADGIPGKESLTKLGHRHGFTVTS
jgi:GH25 family lysozyme M1 (1,4-beta-N-acetylmuramidase)